MDTAALKGSWAKVAAAGDDVPLYFYSHLFLSHPEVRSMFPIQMSGQRDKLVAALGAVVSSVDELDTVIPLLRCGRLASSLFSLVVGPTHYE
jgi:hemoglobin-like flavoprotein